MFAQTKGLGVPVQGGNTRQAAYFVEKIVAGNVDGVHHVDGTMGTAVGIVDPAGRLIGGGVIGVASQSLDLLGRGDDAAFQRGNRGQRLEGGAGGISALGGAIEHGIGGVGHQFIEVLIIGGQMKGGV